MSTLTLYPYFRRGAWVFDDPHTGLKEEAFVHGADAVLTRLVYLKSIPAAERGFTLRFSDEPFDGADAELTWLRCGDPQPCSQDEVDAPVGGNWYSCVVGGQEMHGWLCDSLLKFYSAPPARIFVKVEPLPTGVVPKWRDHGPSARHAVVSPEKGIPGE